MATKITAIVGTSIEQIKKKKHSIFVPISLGNKWFTKENIKEYLLWALKNSKTDVLVVIADELHQINIEVKDRYKPARAKRKVCRIAGAMKGEVKSAISTLDKRQQARIKVIFWSDVRKDKKYLSLQQEVCSEFAKNRLFREKIIEIVREGVKNIKHRAFTEEKIMRLSQYVLNELPLFLHGIRYENTLYDLHPYPLYTKVCALVDEIQKGAFSELYKRLQAPKAAIVTLEVFRKSA